jgi:hypothetical protein
MFLWHFPWGRPRRPLAGTVFPWSPDFPRPACDGEARPSGHLAAALRGADVDKSNRPGQQRDPPPRLVIRDAVAIFGAEMALKGDQDLHGALVERSGDG